MGLRVEGRPGDSHGGRSIKTQMSTKEMRRLDVLERGEQDRRQSSRSKARCRGTAKMDSKEVIMEWEGQNSSSWSGRVVTGPK